MSLQRALGFAFILGLCAPWIDGWLVEHTFGPIVEVEQFFVVRLYRVYNWSYEEIRPLAHLYYDVVSALISGAILGLPLGLLFKQRWLISWLSFLVAWLLAAIFGVLDSEFGVADFLFLITWPGFLLTLLATLAFAFAGHRALSAHSNRSATAA
jgi:hypothetical protein